MQDRSTQNFNCGLFFFYEGGSVKLLVTQVPVLANL